MTGAVNREEDIMNEKSKKNVSRVFRVLFGSIAMGVGSTLIFLVVLMVFVGGKKAGNIVFGYSPAIFIIGFGALWFSYVNKHLK